MATAYILMTNGGHPIPFAIYKDEVIIVFVLIVFGITSYDIPEIAEGDYSILRFMIDEKYLKRGYGRKSLEKIIEYIRTYPMGYGEYCWLEFNPGNRSAKNLYLKNGFYVNGEFVNGETVAVLKP